MKNDPVVGVQHSDQDGCDEAVADQWEVTKQYDNYLVIQCYVDEYDMLQAHNTKLNFKRGDEFIAMVEMGKMIGREIGHPEEYIKEFENALKMFLFQTIGRDPKPAPLPLASHLQVVGDRKEEVPCEGVADESRD